MDQLSLSLWLPRGLKQSRIRQFEKLLRTFPFSQRTQPQSLLSIHGVDSTEPPLLERPVNGPIDPAEIMAVFQEYSGDDIAYELDSWWDLWHFNDEWALAPTRVALACFGTEFDNGTGRGKDQEDLRSISAQKLTSCRSRRYRQASDWWSQTSRACSDLCTNSILR